MKAENSPPKTPAAQGRISAEAEAARLTDFIVLGCFALAAIFGLAALANLPFSLVLIAALLFIAAAWSFWTLRKRSVAALSGAMPQTLGETARISVARGLLDSLPQAAAIIDKDQRLIHANALAKELIHIGDMGGTLGSYLPRADIESRLSRAVAGFHPEPLSIEIDTPEHRFVRLLFSPAWEGDSAAAQLYCLVVFDDETQTLLAQQQRADFLANASHELKTPIASLMGYIETLQGHAKNDPEAREKFLGIMQSQAERMQRLIQDLLSLRRIELSEHIAPQSEADLVLAIKSALQAVSPLAEKREINLHFAPSEDVQRAMIDGQQDECVQLCLNLIENAVKISPQGASVKIALRRVDDWNPSRAYETAQLSPSGSASRAIIKAAPSPLPAWQITIADTGPGFAREHIPRLGERFYRIAGDLSSKEKGTGLGLAIVKHIVRRHRGGLYIRSVEGAGTEFFITMMAAQNGR